MTFENHTTGLGECFTILKSSQTAILWAVSRGNKIIRFDVWPVFYTPNQGWDYDEDKVREFSNLRGAEIHFQHLTK